MVETTVVDAVENDLALGLVDEAVPESRRWPQGCAQIDAGLGQSMSDPRPRSDE